MSPVRVTVNVNAVVPLFPSDSEAFVAAIAGDEEGFIVFGACTLP